MHRAVRKKSSLPYLSLFLWIHWRWRLVKFMTLLPMSPAALCMRPLSSPQLQSRWTLSPIQSASQAAPRSTCLASALVPLTGTMCSLKALHLGHLDSALLCLSTSPHSSPLCCQGRSQETKSSLIIPAKNPLHHLSYNPPVGHTSWLGTQGKPHPFLSVYCITSRPCRYPKGKWCLVSGALEGP